MIHIRRIIVLAVCGLLLLPLHGKAEVTVSSPSVVLMESSTGTVLYEKNGTERRKPASVTKVMTLLLTFEAIEKGQVGLADEVIVSEHAASMGGSQVFLEEGEVQSLETMIKCITVASGNDASVAVAEHIAGSEEAFVELMNDKARSLGMTDTHFADCCGLTESEDHFSCARDVAIMSGELTEKYPEIYRYSGIWMEDITHHTRRGDSVFTLSSTNKLLKQYSYCTGLKTGFTSKAGFCVAATASKDGVNLIAVVMGASQSKERNNDAKALFAYGFGTCRLYRDNREEPLPPLKVSGGLTDTAEISYLQDFVYLDTEGRNLSAITRETELPEELEAPLKPGDSVGRIRYYLENEEIGSVPIICLSDVEKASFGQTILKVVCFLLF